LDSDTILRISFSFGGGMGRLREVCGAVTCMFMAAEILEEYIKDKREETIWQDQQNGEK